MTWTKQRHRLSILLVVLGLTLGMVSVSHAQRFVRPINSIPELVASNPNDPHTNVFIPQGPTGPGFFYQWRKNDAGPTNANQSVIGSDWPGASGRWYNIPVAQGSITGISNSGTNGFAVVNTLSDLRNIPGNLGIGMVYIRGHSQAYDWGQGFFSRVDDCSVPDDDGLTSVHGNDALTCWTRENRFPWGGTPVQYAGGTVSIPIINTVSAYLETEGGGSVFIPPGEWPVASSTDGPILGYSNVEIVGGSSPLLVGDGGGTMINWTNVRNAALIGVGISNVVEAIVLRGCTNILIGGNAISQVGDGVRQYGGDNVRIEHNIFSVVTNGVHYSLDGAVKVTGGSLIGNTFSGMLGSNVLEDAGTTDGYRQFDSGAVLKLTQLLSAIQMGTNKVLRVISGSPEGVESGDPGSVAIDRSNGDVWRKATGTGNTGWQRFVSGAAGNDTELQYNELGSLGATNVLVYDRTSGSLVVDSQQSTNVISIPLRIRNTIGNTQNGTGIQAESEDASGNIRTLGNLLFSKIGTWTITDSTRDSYVDIKAVLDGSAVSAYKFTPGNPSQSKIGNTTIFIGTGTPEGLQPAPVGDLWLRTDGGASTVLYVKESGVSFTGWVAQASHRSATATLDFDLTAAVSHDLTITVTGAVDGDTVSVGVPNGSVTADTVFFGWVSAANTVTIRATRNAGTPDPASGTFRATVTRF